MLEAGTLRPRLTLGALVLLGCIALADPPTSSVQPAADGAVSAAQSDVAAFRAIVARVAAGEPYYPTTGDVLRSNGFDTGSVFNWRTPLLTLGLASVPLPVAEGLMVGLLALLLVLALTVAVEPLPLAILMAGVVAFGAAEPTLYYGEAWAGVLIGLSACAYAKGYSWPGLALGLAALFVRELAAPYCLVATGIALWHRRWPELGAWVAGGVAYLSFFAWHADQVAAQQLATDAVHASWLQFGGLPFLQATMSMLGWFFVLPSQAAAVALVLVVAGSLHPKLPMHVKAGAAVYAIAFLVAGLPFNFYWGWVVAPIWAITAAFGVGTIRERLS